jgi:hypothetical protein
MAWVSEPALSVIAEARLEDMLGLATLGLAMLVLHTAEAVHMEAAHYRWPEPFQVPQSYRVAYLFRVRHSRTLAAPVCLGRTAADMLGHTAADTLGRTAHPDTTTSVYRTRVTQWAATVPPARQRQEWWFSSQRVITVVIVVVIVITPTPTADTVVTTDIDLRQLRGCADNRS